MYISSVPFPLHQWWRGRLGLRYLDVRCVQRMRVDRGIGRRQSSLQVERNLYGSTKHVSVIAHRVALAACVSLSIGCSTEADGDINSVTQGTLESVSQGEYQAAFGKFSECVVAAGHELQSVGPLSGSPDILSYIIPAGAVNDGSGDGCYEQEFSYYDLRWQQRVFREHPEQDPTRRALAICADAEGVRYGADSSATEIEQALRAAGVEPVTCRG